MDNTGSAGGAIDPKRLFIGSCTALIATAVAFAVVGASMGALKEHFLLSNEEVGWIGGAALWGFSLSILVFGPLVDAFSMRVLLRLAFIGHVAGVLMMIFAGGFTLLFVGALTIAMGNGLVEAACNPLVTTIYPDRKTQMLNRFHVWFPGGIVIGGLCSYALDSAGFTDWRLKLGLVLIPAVAYGILFTGKKFPATERVQSGVTFMEMVKETFMRPLFILLALCMLMTASLELGPNRWVPAVLESAGIPGILVLVWINLLMAILRFFAGPVVHRIAPTGLLFVSAIIAGIGLTWLSYADSLGVAIMAGTVFALGVCYFWPTMLGVTSERVPKGGALALGFMGGIGMAVVGLVTSPMMGKVADEYLHDQLPPQQTLACLTQVVGTYPGMKAGAMGTTGEDLQAAVNAAQGVLDAQAKSGSLPRLQTANALRSAIAAAPSSPAAAAAKEILGPAENYGGKISFRHVAPLSIILAVVFGILFFSEKARGGYRVVKLTSAQAPPTS
ncbi:MAG TPA: MFS transporter [Bacteroidota bacterium]|nr:MFS transporter [Bacteroidota bacterium]